MASYISPLFISAHLYFLPFWIIGLHFYYWNIKNSFFILYTHLCQLFIWQLFFPLCDLLVDFLIVFIDKFLGLMHSNLLIFFFYVSYILSYLKIIFCHKNMYFLMSFSGSFTYNSSVSRSMMISDKDTTNFSILIFNFLII